MRESNKGEIGRIGEKTAVAYLSKNGHTLLDTNYRKPWGEIDIVTRNRGVIHFIEVKTVSRRLDLVLDGGYKNWYEASDNIHTWKRQRLERVISSYLEDRYSESDDPDWQFDVVLVELDLSARKARIEILEDLELS